MLKGPENTPYAKTLADRYLDCGLGDVGVGRGVVNRSPIHFSSGVEVTIVDIEDLFRTSE